MLATHIPLRMIAQYEHVTFPEDGTLDERKNAVEVLLKNCRITRDIGTDQMNGTMEPDLKADIHEMRAAALMAIPLAETALRTNKLEDFNDAEREFRTQYVKVIRSVKSFLWDAKGSARHHLWPLVEELM